MIMKPFIVKACLEEHADSWFLLITRRLSHIGIDTAILDIGIGIHSVLDKQ